MDSPLLPKRRSHQSYHDSLLHATFLNVTASIMTSTFKKFGSFVFFLCLSRHSHRYLPTSTTFYRTCQLNKDQFEYDDSFQESSSLPTWFLTSMVTMRTSHSVGTLQGTPGIGFNLRKLSSVVTAVHPFNSKMSSAKWLSIQILGFFCGRSFYHFSIEFRTLVRK